MIWSISSVTIFIVFLYCSVTIAQDPKGPLFVVEPPSKVIFYNNTEAVIPCSATGSPNPVISWIDERGDEIQDILHLRHIKQDGSLVFPPFSASEYRQDIHMAVFTCVASNIVGSIRSQDVQVRAVIYQKHEVKVYNENVLQGNTGLLRCLIPSSIRDHVTVTSWTRTDGHVIFPSQSYDSNAKHVAFPTGELHVRHADYGDGDVSYRCHVTDRLARQSFQSATSGRLNVIEPYSHFRPKFVHFNKVIIISEGNTVYLPCLAKGYPNPRYSWYQLVNGRMTTILRKPIEQIDCTLVLHYANVKDSGTYVCIASNEAGEERLEAKLTVIEPLKVTAMPKIQKVNVGVSITMNCSMSGFPIELVMWFKDHRPLLANRRISFPRQNVIHINPTQQEDGGMYQCFIQNNHETVQDTAELIVVSKPPVLISTFDEMTVKPGSRVSLKCAAVGNPLPQITWTSYDEPVPDNNRIRTGDYVNKEGAVISFVNITRIEVVDGGIYRCSATNTNGVTSHVASLNVFGRPIIRPMRNRTVIGGRDTVVHCLVSGYPVQQVYWEKGNKRLPLGRRHIIFSNGTLIIRKVGRFEDEGVYRCVAQDTEGRLAHRDVSIKVSVPPVISPFAFPPEPREGIRASVMCSVQEGDPPIQITWWKDGELLQTEDDTVTIDTNNNFISTLIIKTLQSEHSGLYTCVASNAAASVNLSATLTVNSPSRWKTEPRDTSAITGSDAVLDCQAFGRPEPRVVWKKSNDDTSSKFNTVISGARVQVLVNGSLVIRNVQEDDGGRFMCEASNSVGSPISTVVQLDVHVPAHFETKLTSKTTVARKPTTLECEGGGDKPLTFTWFKENRRFNAEGEERYRIKDIMLDDVSRSELTILSAENRDTGMYTCEVQNSWGKDETNIQLLVLDHPAPPEHIRVKKVDERSVSLEWGEPPSGNNPIKKYILSYKTEGDSTRNKPQKIVVQGDQREVVIRDLKPMTTYLFNLVAENAIGRSLPSADVSVITEEEAPTSPPVAVEIVPVNSRALKVTWKRPVSTESFRTVKGYYIGYKVVGSEQDFIYKSVEVTSHLMPYEYELNNLQPGTSYLVVVQAFNQKGVGPGSRETSVKTPEFDPPDPPKITLSFASSSSIEITWQISSRRNKPISGFILHYRQQPRDWMQIHILGDKTSYSIQGLKCGTSYQMYIIAFNSMGKSDASDIISGVTKGSAPVAPSQNLLVTVNSTTMVIRLNAWSDGGCPINHFILQYKPLGHTEWIMVSSEVYPEQETVSISMLIPGSWYLILMSAVNSAGITEAEYRIATLSPSGATIIPNTVSERSGRSKYRSLYVIIPVCCAAVVLTAVTLSVFLVVCRRRSSSSSNTYEGVHHSDDPKGETLVMTELEKQYGDIGEPTYFPSPYAMTKIPVLPREVANREGESFHGSTRGSGNNYDVPQPRKSKFKMIADHCQDTRNGSDGSSDYEGTAEHSEGYEQPRKQTRSRSGESAHHGSSRWPTPLQGTHSDYCSSQDAIYSPIHLASSSCATGSYEPSDTECDRDFSEGKDIWKPKVIYPSSIYVQTPFFQR
ncbi:Down syndrome cell adhesion molecule-like protein Dscam2 isoform X1 [Limulus polyphemus]|uniref:Down syndrome cell adhesion molecule-like protein Dscam2 isoform X1 n=1 Tax=Limulus polyphemus TaxID=6850 RepID=A0ABM1SKS8_LIMPO|nr:Down syndrome cell adhesion molecule-like protein Dscam2 isoform X1 [Limulus polyphemus]